VIFDFRAPTGTGQAVDLSALAEEVADMEIERSIGVLSRRSELLGERAWAQEDVTPPEWE
jgi:hypothetical protein